MKRDKVTKFLPIVYTKVIDEDKGIVEELVSVYGNIDHGKDIIHPGMFKKSIQENLKNILVLDQHNTGSIFSALGKPLSLREIGRDELPAEVQEKFPDATGGLLATTQYQLETPEGKGAFLRIKEGVIKQRSIGFEALDFDYESVRAVKTDTGYERRSDKSAPEVNIRNLRTGKLMEYSPVLWGMNEATTTVSAKDGLQPVGEVKEPTPDGAVRRMGDYLMGQMSQMMGMMCGQWLADGKISRDEHASAMQAVGSCMMAFEQAMPAEVMDREMDMPRAPMGGMMGGDLFMFNRPTDPQPTPPAGATNVLSAPPAPENKAGRVLSRRNEDALRSAVTALQAVLEQLGMDDEDEKQQAAPAAPVLSVSPFQAGPESVTADDPPTSAELNYVRARLQQLHLAGGTHGTARTN